MINEFDVDIDTPPSFKPETLFPTWVKAAVVKDEALTPHPCGIYPQAVAKDKVTGLSSISYDDAENLGYFKLDFLHNSVYTHFESQQEIQELIKIEPNWDLLLIPSQVIKLFQLSKHIELLQKIKPKSIEDLADALALIRPGKKDLIPLYVKDKSSVRNLLYKKDKSGYSFKKSHAHSYSLVVVLQLHLIEAGVI